MGILFRRPSVRRPPGVPHAVVAPDGLSPKSLFEPSQLAGAPTHLHLPFLHEGDTSRVIASVCELAEAVNEDGDDVFGSDVADDAAHVVSWLG